MYEKNDYVQYWLESANHDWDVANSLFQSGKYVYSLFFGPSVLEKVCKALWVAENQSNFPTKTHNLLWLLKNTYVELSNEQEEDFLIINTFQLESRYPDYSRHLFKTTDQDSNRQLLNRINHYRLWLLEQLPSNT